MRLYQAIGQLLAAGRNSTYFRQHSQRTLCLHTRDINGVDMSWKLWNLDLEGLRVRGFTHFMFECPYSQNLQIFVPMVVSS
jgi:hypothetical protein